MADLNIAVDDVLYVAIVSYKYTKREYDYTVPGYPKPYTESVALGSYIAGPYVSKASVKRAITKFKQNHSRDKAFEVTSVKLNKTEFDWKEEVF